MTCGRSQSVDVESFLIDSGAEAFASFRSHYPDCADCAAAVARWSALDLALRDVLGDEVGLAPVHPDPERLERFTRAPQSMGNERMEIQAHVDGCMSCQTEIEVLRRLAPLAAVAGDVAEAGADGFFAKRVAPLFSRPAVPAFALAALIVLGLWSAGVFEAGPAVPPAPTVARQTPPPSAPAPATATAPAPGEDDAERLALAPAPPEPSDAGAVEPRPDPPAPAPLRLAEAPAPVPAPAPAEAPSAEPAPADRSLAEFLGGARGEAVLVEAVTSMPPPDYRAPLSAADLGWLDRYGAVRSAGGPTAKALVLAPTDHAGLSLEASPRLWWVLDQDTALGVQVTLVDEEGIEPLLRLDLPGPHAKGLQAIDLSTHDVVLQPGVEYRWFVSLQVDPKRPSRNPVSAGAVRVVDEDDARRASIGETEPAARGHAFAESGLWYDAYDFFASLAEAHPEERTLAGHRDRLGEDAVEPR